MSAAEVKCRGKNEYTQRQKIIESITRAEQRKDKRFELNFEELKGFWSPGFLRVFIYSTNTCLGMRCDFKFQKPIMKLGKVILLYILYKEVNRLPKELTTLMVRAEDSHPLGQRGTMDLPEEGEKAGFLQNQLSH